MIAPGDKRRQVTSGEYTMREGTMRAIAPGDQRRQVVSGVVGGV